jgi:hypothetical protein
MELRFVSAGAGVGSLCAKIAVAVTTHSPTTEQNIAIFFISNSSLVSLPIVHVAFPGPTERKGNANRESAARLGFDIRFEK